MTLLEQEALSAIKSYCRKKTLRTHSFTAYKPEEIDEKTTAFLNKGYCIRDVKIVKMDLGVLVTILYE